MKLCQLLFFAAILLSWQPFKAISNPVVSITSPGPLSSSIIAPATVNIQASASSEGVVIRVEFYANDILIGISRSNPYSFNWSNMALGDYSLTAVAYDNHGKTATSSPVPVSIIDGTGTYLFRFIKFTGSNRGRKNNLDWVTSNASNTHLFDIERSADGINFTTVASMQFIPMSGNTISYQYIDPAVPDGTNYYRIKRTTITNDVFYSDIIAVRRPGGNTRSGMDKQTNNSESKGNISVGPNPVHSGILDLRLGNIPRGTYKLTILNANGQPVYSSQVNHMGGTFLQTIPVDTRTSGIYYVQLSGGPGNYILKMLRQ
jgi:hypothetical protein